MYNYLGNDYQVNIKWENDNLKIKWFLCALMQFLMDLSVTRLIVALENSFILNRNEKNQALCFIVLGSVFLHLALYLMTQAKALPHQYFNLKTNCKKNHWL